MDCRLAVEASTEWPDEAQHLSGYCMLASRFFIRIARKNGFQPVLVKGEFDEEGNHCWTEWHGKLIDLTATQYDFTEKVLVLPADHKLYRPLLKGLSAERAVRAWKNPFGYRESVRKYDSALRKLYDLRVTT